MARVFLSHTSRDSEFVIQVAQYLKRGMEVFYYEDSQVGRVGNFIDILDEELLKATAIIFFIGEQLGNYQKKEIHGAIQRDPGLTIFLINMSNVESQVIINSHFLQLPPHDVISVGAQPAQNEAFNTAHEIFIKLNIPWVARDGLPWDPHLFSYEKDIINFFKKKVRIGQDLYSNPENHRGTARANKKASGSPPPDPTKEDWEKALEEAIKEQQEMIRKLQDGCPVDWPEVERWEKALESYRNLPTINKWRRRPYESQLKDAQFRPPGNMVVAAALTTYHGEGCTLTPEECLIHRGFCFPEAGPREHLYFPPQSNNHNLGVAILVSGGIAPGINAVIDGIVQRHWKYAVDHGQEISLQIFGIKNGFLGLSTLQAAAFIPLVPNRGVGQGDNRKVTSEHANEGGSMLETFTAG